MPGVLSRCADSCVKKVKRVRLSISFKCKILEMIDNKIKYDDIIARLQSEFNVKLGKSTISEIKKDREKLQSVLVGNVSVLVVICVGAGWI